MNTDRGDLNYVGDEEGHPDAPANRRKHRHHYKHRHNYYPVLSAGVNDDGSAKWWACDCGKQVRFAIDYRVIVGDRR